MITHYSLQSIFSKAARCIIGVGMIVINPTSFAASPEVMGNFTTDIQLDSVTNIAVADGSIAQVIIGSITDAGNLQGDFDVSVSAGAITNASVGKNGCAQIIIASLVGTSTCSAGGGAKGGF